MGYETIASLAAAFGIKSSTPFEVVGVMVLNVHEMPLIATVHHAGGRKTSDIALVVEDKPDVDVDTDRSTSVEVRLCTMEEKLFIMNSRISSIDSKLSSMDSRLSSMDSRQSSMDSRLSFMDSRLSSMESKLDCLIKLFSSAYNTTGFSVTFDPYHPVPDEVARQYAHFMEMSGNDQTVELFWITVGKDYFRDMKCNPK
ncbi:hypothetical protein FNV43_RR00004 [Rhamnella rubrinervis]|uniref:Uncharacterized protein n=1 Tax=Rhamnella rubrinervis TaxID=2594499 RepID=A0A8K0HMT5_9ROSA|nr:hypothetical protein FNV43_RR00004 [Rhamnella rubrinervis]